MIFQKSKRNRHFGITLLLVWALLWPEIYMQNEFSCLQREDGTEISEEEAEKIWEELYLGEIDPGKITYKLWIVEWLKEQGY